MIAAVALVILETLAPGVTFLWLGIGAAVTGLITLAPSNLNWHLQFMIFTCISVIAGFGGRAWLKRNPTETDKPLLNQRSAQYVDNIYTLEHSIENGSGWVWVGDSDWIVKGDDMPIGSQVKVIGTEGASLSVEKLVDETP